MPTPVEGHERAARSRVTVGHFILEGLAALLLGAALAATYAGPIRLEIGPWALSVRTVSRPLVAAIVLLVLRVIVPMRSGDLHREIVPTISRIALGALAAAGVTGWLMYLSTTIGGADSYGYVSAAQRIVDGRLIAAEPLAPLLPFDDAVSAATPLGYVPSSRQPHASAPAYPLGLPAIMAVASLVGGREAPFAVAPLTGILLLVAASMLAWWWYRDPVVTLLTFALLAVHPLVFTYSIQPMSDVPAALCVVAGLVALERKWPLLAGIAGAMALFIRPALAPTVAMLPAIELAIRGKAGWRNALRVAAPLVGADAGQAALHVYLYGAVFASGYGGVGDLFSLERIAANLRSHTYWAIASLGVPALAAFAIGLAVSSYSARVMFALVTAALLATYLPYRTYDHWETLRFLMPAVVLMTVMIAAGVVAVSRRAAGHAGGAALAALLAFGLAGTWVAWLAETNVFAMPEHERRHRLAAEMVEQATPPDAVILALQHSGSVRYYAGRDTLNWQRMPPGSIPETVRVLSERGRSVYVMIDSAAELAEFRHNHGPILEQEGWLPSGQRRDVQLYQAPRR